jgi:KDO2-lipid IV(A) lauroyltransferase
LSVNSADQTFVVFYASCKKSQTPTFMLVALFRLLSRFPLPFMHAVGKALGWLVYGLSPTYRKRLNQNMKRAGFAACRNEAVGEIGKSILELPYIWYAPPQKVMATARIENWPLVQAVLDEGKGAIFLTPHLGCFEVIAQAIAQQVPLTALYRPPRKAALRPLMETARARHNLALAPATLAGVRTLLKTLKQGQAIGLLPDQVPQQGEGIWAEFFGKPAYTMTLPAKLHTMTGAPLILSYAERLPRGAGYRIFFVRFDRELEGSPEQQARAINAAMEALIERCPAQYFWSYNRYKIPAGVTAPAAASEEAR